MKMRLLFLLLPVVFFSLSCKKYKYDEDDHISAKKAMKFLTAKPWILKEYIVDDIESGNQIFSYTEDSVYFLNWKYRNAEFTFDKAFAIGSSPSGRGTVTFDYMKDENGSDMYGNAFHNFNWSLDKRADHLNLTKEYSGSTLEFDFFFPQESMWTILRLTDKELIISGADDFGRRYRMKLNTI